MNLLFYIYSIINHKKTQFSQYGQKKYSSYFLTIPLNNPGIMLFYCALIICRVKETESSFLFAETENFYDQNEEFFNEIVDGIFEQSNPTNTPITFNQSNQQIEDHFENENLNYSEDDHESTQNPRHSDFSEETAYHATFHVRIVSQPNCYDSC